MARRQVSIFINGKKVAKEIGLLTAEKRKLQRALNRMTIGSKEYNATMKELDKLNPVINNHRKRLHGIASTWDKVKSGAASLAGMAGIGGIAMSAQMAAEAIQQVVADTKRLRREISQLTGATGNELDMLTTRTGGISKTFEQEQKAVLQSANVLVKEFNISYGEAFDNIENGFLNGADASGDFLENIREYSTQFREAGFSAEDFIRISTRAQREGIFSDKGLDAVKEFGLRIREQTKSTTDALENAFGKEFTDGLFDGINGGSATTAEALQRVSREMNNLEVPTAQLQTVIADVFGGAGEDAGLRYLQGLRDIQDETITATADTNAYIEAQRELLTANTELSGAENELAKQLESTGDRFTLLWTNIKTFGISTLSELVKIIEHLPTTFRGLWAAIQQPFKNLFGDPEDAKSATAAFYDTVLAEAEKHEATKTAAREQATHREEERLKKIREEQRRRRLERMRRQTEREVEELEKRQQRLAETIEKFQQQQEQAGMSAGDRKLERIRLQYQKQIDLAKDLEKKGAEEATEQRKELERLREIALTEELDRQFHARQAQLDEQSTQGILNDIGREKAKAEAKRNADLEISNQLRQYILDEQELALMDLENHFDRLLDLARAHGIDTLDIEITYRKQRKELLDKSEKEDREKFIEDQKKKAGALAEAFQGMGTAVSGALDLATAAGIKNTATGKLLAIAQIGLSSAEAIARATAASAGVPFPGNIAAIATAVGTVLANIAQAKKIIGGVEVPQKFMGGFTEVRGATDGKKYRARYIGDRPTGMLDFDSPVLTASGILANERGPEYFVASGDLRRPAVLDHVRAIENLTGARQFQTGGSTAPLPPGESRATVPKELMDLMVNINETLQLIQQTPRRPLIGDDEIVRLGNRQRKLREVSGGTVG